MTTFEYFCFVHVGQRRLEDVEDSQPLELVALGRYSGLRASGHLDGRQWW